MLPHIPVVGHPNPGVNIFSGAKEHAAVLEWGKGVPYARAFEPIQVCSAVPGEVEHEPAARALAGPRGYAAATRRIR